MQDARLPTRRGNCVDGVVPGSGAGAYEPRRAWRPVQGAIAPRAPDQSHSHRGRLPRELPQGAWDGVAASGRFELAALVHVLIVIPSAARDLLFASREKADPSLRSG